MSEPVTDNDVEALVQQFQHLGLRELHVRCGGREIYLSADTTSVGIDASASSPHSAPAQRSAAPQAALKVVEGQPVAAPAEVTWPDGAQLVRAPYLGTFYRSPKPGSPAYVELGAQVAPDSELCLVEVMKLFTAVRAGVAGTVHAILADDGQMVAAGQSLFVVMPLS